MSQKKKDAFELAISPGRSRRRKNDVAVLLKHTPKGSNLQNWKPSTPPEVSKSPSTSRAPPQKKCRRSPSLSENMIARMIEIDSGSDAGSSDTDDDDEAICDFRAKRQNAAILRNKYIEDVGRMMSSEREDVNLDERVAADAMDEGVMPEESVKEDESESGPSSLTAYEGLIAIGAHEGMERVMKEERIEVAADEDIEPLTLSQAYEGLDVFSWSDDFSTFSGQAETYLRIPGTTVVTQDPVDIFKNIWDDKIMEYIAMQTNKYASQFIDILKETNNIPAYLTEWKEVTVPELYKYFAVINLMTLCYRSKIAEYWCTDILGMPGFRAAMPRNRFIMISKFLHFADNQELDSELSSYEKKIFKIKPILDHCNEKFAKLYIPNKHLSLDESLLLWKGRLSWAQCIRTKAARFGIKSYELCEAVTGYQLRCLLYAGKDSTACPEPIHGFEKATAKVVLKLMDGFLNVGHTLVMDNFYNQLPLSRFLKRLKTDVLGTLNPRWDYIPDDIKNAKDTSLKKGDQIARHCGDINLVSWQDVKLVTAMSTYHSDAQLPARRAGADISKPEMIIEYNKYMGGVDSKDQKLSMFLMERKRGKKWYIKVFKRLLNTSLLNAYIIYRKSPTLNNLSHRDFRRTVAIGLLQRYAQIPDKPTAPYLPIMAERRLQSGNHFVGHTKKVPGKNKLRQRTCVRCAALGRRTLVTVLCTLCCAPLCIGVCWAEYHTLRNLK